MANILGTGYQVSSKASRVDVDGAFLTLSSWKATVTGDDTETTNFESYVLASDTTYKEGILGPIEAALEFGGDWDAGVNPLDNPPGLYPRDDLQNLAFIVNRTINNFWDFPYARLRNCASGAGPMNTAVTFTCSGMSQGPFAFPIGSAA